MKSMMKRTTLREIWNSLGRYLAILAIVALGVGFFAGLRVAKTAMMNTGDTYLREQKMFDYRLLSTMGFQEADVEAVLKDKDVAFAEGAVSVDFIYVDKDGKEGVLCAYSLTENVNTPSVVEGRLPEKADECVIDARMMGCAVGDKIQVSENNDEDTGDLFAKKTYTVTGKVDSPLYLNFERGSTSLLSGKVDGFVYIPKSGFDSEYYTEIDVRLSHDLKAYSGAYEDFIDEKSDAMEALCEERSNLRYETVVADANKEINDAKTELADKEAEAREELADAKKKIDDAETELADANDELDKNEKKLRDAKRQLKDGLAQIADGKAQMETMGFTMGPQWDALLAQEQELNNQLATVNSGLRKIDEGREEVREHEEELADAKKEYEDGKHDFEEEIADAKQKLADAETELADLDEPDSYALSRETNVGYVCFENDVNIVEGVSVVFPVFFFLVAALVCITTMNRMVEEQRTQIGVLKALGYGNAKIMSKYMFYSGSAALTGGVLGFFAGSYIFPKVIWTAYGMLYGFSDEIEFVLDIPLAVISLIVAMICSIGATYFSCYYELSSVAAELIRPKAPKNGKRIFLERIGFIWKRLKFLHKVSIRNVVRYKRRFFMMVVGISGCSALLVAGFGIKDSIKNLIPKQFEEIQIYDMLITFKDEPDQAEMSAFDEKMKETATDWLLAREESVDVEAGGKMKSATLVVPKESSRMSDFISVQTIKGEEIPFPKDDEVVLTQKTAERLGVTVGSTVTVRDSDRKEQKFKVSGVAENYVGDYVYMTPEGYTDGLQKKLEYTNCLVNLKNKENYEENGAFISELDVVISATANKIFEDRFNNMIVSLDYIVLLVISCAAALAFIVLYNLTNINITERIREIATIKVLGFYPGETAAYVFRENFMLTAIGGLAGLFLGKLLHAYVMYMIDLDAITFMVYVSPRSYLYSFLLTFVFAMVVNGFMYFKLQKINMAESLKSIE